MVEDFLEFGRGFAAMMHSQIGLAAHIRWIQTSVTQFVGNGSLKELMQSGPSTKKEPWWRGSISGGLAVEKQ
jgi:hypothetical protein